MGASKSVLVVHPDSQVRLLVRSLLQESGCEVFTGPSWPAPPGGEAPAILLMDRSFLDRQGLDALSDCRRHWNETEVVFLPEGLETSGTRSDSMVQLLAHVDRLLAMKTTKELIAPLERRE